MHPCNSPRTSTLQAVVAANSFSSDDNRPRKSFASSNGAQIVGYELYKRLRSFLNEYLTRLLKVSTIFPDFQQIKCFGQNISGRN